MHRRVLVIDRMVSSVSNLENRLASAVQETCSKPAATLLVSRGPWYGFNGVHLIAADPESAVMARETGVLRWRRITVTRIERSAILLHPNSSVLDIAPLGRYRARSAEALLKFAAAAGLPMPE